MATPEEVLSFLIPNGGYVLVGNTYEGLMFLECEPITKEQYEAGFAEVDAWKTQQAAEAQAKRSAALAKLEALGLDEDDLQALGL